MRGDRGGDAGERDRVSPRARLLGSGGHEIPLHRRDLQQSREGRFLGLHRRGIFPARQEKYNVHNIANIRIGVGEKPGEKLLLNCNFGTVFRYISTV